MIVWSGGADSTLLLCRELKEKGNANVLSFSNQQAASCVSDAKARKEILKTLRSRGYTINQTEVRVSASGEIGVTEYGSCQPVWWLGLSVPYVPNGGSLKFGYIRGDDFWHHKSEFIWASHYLESFLHKSFDVEFPLEWSTKADVIRELRTHRIISKISFCEGMTSKPCKKCDCCKRHYQALRELREEK